MAEVDWESIDTSFELTDPRRWAAVIGLWAAIFLGLYFLQEANFLLFHSLAELFSIVIAGGVFLVAWNSRHRMANNFLFLLGVAYAFIGFLDAIHTLSYVGMGVFPDHDANLPTQLWVAARYLEVVSILAATVFIGSSTLDDLVSFGHRTRDIALLVGIYLVVTAGLLVAIFGGVFPDAFIEGVGLTPFKIISEYVIIAVLAVVLGMLYRYRSAFEPHVFWFLSISLVFTMAAEFAFTQYVSVFGQANMVGHFFKLASFYLIYLAVIKTGISAPQKLLFRQLTEERDKLADRERQLNRQNDQLEKFASIVSHDLRNPLNMAQNYVELVREECESEDLDGLARTHDRMQLLIDDLLELARAGELIDETVIFDLGELVESSWQNVDTRDATIDIQTIVSVEADRSRVQQLLENLFRNAIEHGGSDVVVTVGDLDDGFYVEDDGSGISEDKRSEVFVTGYSTAEQGTGFGLNIVQDIAQAHGWHLAVTEESEGGARFEFKGLDLD